MRVRFYADSHGRYPVRDYFRELSRAGEQSAPATLSRFLERLESEGPALPMPLARMIDRTLRLYELRVGDHRVAYAVHRDEIWLLHAWRKRSQRLDRREVDRARRHLSDLN